MSCPASIHGIVDVYRMSIAVLHAHVHVHVPFAPDALVHAHAHAMLTTTTPTAAAASSPRKPPQAPPEPAGASWARPARPPRAYGLGSHLVVRISNLPCPHLVSLVCPSSNIHFPFQSSDAIRFSGEVGSRPSSISFHFHTYHLPSSPSRSRPPLDPPPPPTQFSSPGVLGTP